jgi:hypothetical protein
MTVSSPFPPRCAQAYAPVKQLAVSGQAHVWLATQRGLERPAVVKLLGPEALASPAEVRRFRDEALVTASLQHEHIVRLYDQDIENGVPWIALEYLEGPSLAARLASGALPLGEALEVGRQIALALAEAHSRGILHRDIKPDNVLRAQPGHWKVADFGIAKWGGSSTVTPHGMFVGTPAYVAPEQIRGEPATPLSDVYALGVLLFHALTGRLPFVASTPVEMMQMHVHSETPRPGSLVAGLPPAVDELLLSAMSRDPAKRPRGAESMAEHLELLMLRLGAQVTGPLRISGSLKIRRPPRSTAARAGAAAAVALVAAGLLAAALTLRSDRGSGGEVPSVRPTLSPTAAESGPAAPNDPTARKLVEDLRAEVAALVSADPDGSKRCAAALRVLRALRHRAGSLAPRHLDGPMCSLALDGLRRDVSKLLDGAKYLLLGVMDLPQVEKMSREYGELVHDYLVLANVVLARCPGYAPDEWLVVAAGHTLTSHRLRVIGKEAQLQLERAISAWHERSDPRCWVTTYLRGSVEKGFDGRRGLVYLTRALDQLEVEMERRPTDDAQWECWSTVIGTAVKTAEDARDPLVAGELLTRVKRTAGLARNERQRGIAKAALDWSVSVTAGLTPAASRPSAKEPGAEPHPSPRSSSR